MNKKIQELKQQAGIDYNPDQEGLDLFAELIVKECTDLFKRTHTYEQYQRRIDKTIRKYFGVEE
jgi:hypothetical protein